MRALPPVLLILGLVLARPAAGQEPGFGGADDPDAALLDGARVVDQEKAAMRRRLAEDRVRSQYLRREESSLLGGLAELDRQVDAQRKKSLAIFARKQKLALSVVSIEAQVATADARLDALKRAVGRRAAAMQRLRRTAFADLLARAESTLELRRLRDRLALVVGYDAQLIAKTRQANAEAERLLAAYRAERALLEAAEAELEREREALLDARADRSALLGAISKERGAIERVAAEIAVAARKLDAELDVIRGQGPAPAPAPGGFAAQRGRLPWPVVGSVEVPFGKRVDPDTGVVMTHKGIDVRARLTEPVRAVFAGKVAYQGTLEGYGRTVILDHDAGWYTVHAHLESFAGPAASPVEAGQVIGFVGDSGSLKGAYLYFEIRQGKSAVDPHVWLAK